ncbi:MAG: hypothetical protein IKD72_06345, partial [Clostridia bacterium]|nr:hypothetical protein [Clostridia bacterium]
MNKKISLGLALALIIMAVTATFAATMAISKQVYNGIINNISQRSQTYASVDEISKLVSNYYYGTVSDSNVLNSALTEGYVDGLGDPNSRYLTAAEYAAYTARLESGVTGIGVETTYDLQGDRLVMEAGYDYSEATVGMIMQLSEEELQDLAARRRAGTFHLEACNSFIPPRLKIAAGQMREELRAYVEEAMRRLSLLGVDIVVFGSGGARRIPEEI